MILLDPGRRTSGDTGEDEFGEQRHVRSSDHRSRFRFRTAGPRAERPRRTELACARRALAGSPSWRVFADQRVSGRIAHRAWRSS